MLFAYKFSYSKVFFFFAMVENVFIPIERPSFFGFLAATNEAESEFQQLCLCFVVYTKEVRGLNSFVPSEIAGKVFRLETR